MTKNERGITLMILVVTIIVILILAGVVMSINMNINKSVDLKEIVANMELIKSVGTQYRDKYIDETIIEKNETDGTVTYHLPKQFVGTHEVALNQGTMINNLLRFGGKEQETLLETSNYWYRLEQKDLDEFKLDIKLNNEYYFLNYSTLSVAYCKDEKDGSQYKGVKIKKNNREKYVYFYDDLKNVKTREVRN